MENLTSIRQWPGTLERIQKFLFFVFSPYDYNIFVQMFLLASQKWLSDSKGWGGGTAHQHVKQIT